MPRGRAAENFQPRHLTQPTDQIFSQSVGEIRLRLIGAREFEGNDGDSGAGADRTHGATDGESARARTTRQRPHRDQVREPQSSGRSCRGAAADLAVCTEGSLTSLRTSRMAATARSSAASVAADW